MNVGWVRPLDGFIIKEKLLSMGGAGALIENPGGLGLVNAAKGFGVGFVNPSKGFRWGVGGAGWDEGNWKEKALLLA